MKISFISMLAEYLRERKKDNDFKVLRQTGGEPGASSDLRSCSFSDLQKDTREDSGQWSTKLCFLEVLRQRKEEWVVLG